MIVPAAGALIIGLMARYGSEKIRGHGIPEALEAILLGRSLIKPKVAILKPVSSAISIGTGGPFGAEGPIIMTGGAFGSIFAQLFHLTSAERKTLLVAGAAAGMSAIFATPVAAILLGVELLLFEWRPRSFIPVALASMTAFLVRMPLLGQGPIFPVPLHGTMTAQSLGIALAVGVFAGLGSCLLTNLVYGFEDLFEKLPFHWMWWPAIGGLVVGLGGLIDPRVLGVGYETIHQLVRGELVGPTLLALLLTKALVWSVALGSGTSGGVLAPLLILGGGIGALLGQWMPGGDSGLWAMVGMAAMMGGTMRSPLTGIIFLMELTMDFNALPALVVGTVAALAVTVLLLRRSILTEKLERRGQHVFREYNVDVFELMRVGDAMATDAPVIPAEMTVSELSDRLVSNHGMISKRQGFLITDPENRLMGIVTRGDIVRNLEKDPKMTVLQAGSSNPVLTYADETLHNAIALMLKHDVGRLPVVDRKDHRKIVGYLGRADILEGRMRALEEEELRERGPLLGSFFPSRNPSSK